MIRQEQNPTHNGAGLRGEALAITLLRNNLVTCLCKERKKTHKDIMKSSCSSTLQSKKNKTKQPCSYAADGVLQFVLPCFKSPKRFKKGKTSL